MAKPVQLRRSAADDIDVALAHHLDTAGVSVATRFVDVLEQALTHIARHPHNGTLRFAYELGVPELRAWPIRHFAYLVFYVDHVIHVDVWRVLHTRRDIPATLAETIDD